MVRGTFSPARPGCHAAGCGLAPTLGCIEHPPRLVTLFWSHSSRGMADEMFAVLSDKAIYEFENQPPRAVAALRAWYADRRAHGSPRTEPSIG